MSITRLVKFALPEFCRVVALLIGDPFQLTSTWYVGCSLFTKILKALFPVPTETKTAISKSILNEFQAHSEISRDNVLNMVNNIARLSAQRMLNLRISNYNAIAS
jgi:hypothetical protein